MFLLLAALLTPAQAGLSFATPTEVSVQLVAGEGTHAGTEDPIWVRVHSEDTGAWSGWRFVSGIGRGETATINMTLSASFGPVDLVDVYIGPDDGARLTVVVDDGAGSLLFTPEARWVKGGTSTFDASLISATVCCTDWNSSWVFDGCATFEGSCPDGLFECTPGTHIGC